MTQKRKPTPAMATTGKHKIETARDLLVDWVDQHREYCHDDCGEVGNVLAFMAHAMGATERDIRELPKRLLVHDLRCPGCDSPKHKGDEHEDV